MAPLQRAARGCSSTGGCPLRWPDGTLDTAMMLDVADERVHAVSVVRNPDRLAHLTARADPARRQGSQLIEL